MLSTPFICCSSGVATDCSTVTASAPVYVAVTMICGGTMSGNWATGNRPIATSPPRTVTIAITMATMGRLTKKADTSVPPAFVDRLDGDACGSHNRALGHERGVNDHARTGLEAVLHDPAVASAPAKRDGLQTHFIVGADDAHLRLALQIVHGPLWNEQCVV